MIASLAYAQLAGKPGRTLCPKALALSCAVPVEQVVRELDQDHRFTRCAPADGGNCWAWMLDLLCPQPKEKRCRRTTAPTPSVATSAGVTPACPFPIASAGPIAEPTLADRIVDLLEQRRARGLGGATAEFIAERVPSEADAVRAVVDARLRWVDPLARWPILALA